MTGFIRHESWRLLTPAFWVVFLIIHAIAWRLVLPPFTYKAVYQTGLLLDRYEMIIRSAGFTVFVLFALSHFNDLMLGRYREQLATRISGNYFITGMLITYFLFYLFCIVMPGYISALSIQLIYAPGRLEWVTILYRFISYPFLPHLLLLMVGLRLYLIYSSEFLSIVIIWAIYILIWLSGSLWELTDLDRIGSERISSYIIPVISDIYKPSNIVCLIVVIIMASRMGRDILNTNFAKIYKSGSLARLVHFFQAYISAHHIRMMGLLPQKILAISGISGAVLVIVLNRALEGKVSLFVNLYVAVLLPLMFSCNQGYIFNPDKAVIENDLILVKTISYDQLIFNRWLILFILQICTGLVALVLVHYVSHLLSIGFLIYVIMLHLIFSLFNFFIRIITGIRSIANIVLVALIYVQLNHAFGDFIRINPLLANFQIIRYLENPQGTPGPAEWLTLLLISGILLFSSLRTLRKYQNAGMQRAG